MDLTHTTERLAHFRCSLPIGVWKSIETLGPNEACRILREALTMVAVKLAVTVESEGGSEAVRPSHEVRGH